MPIPNSTENLRDPGLGQAALASAMPLVFGVTSGAVAKDTLYIYSNPQDLVSEQVGGPAVEKAAFILKQGGGPVGVIPGDPSIAASNGAVTQSGAGPLITLANDATNDFYLYVKITKGGAVGTAKFQYSLDSFSGATNAQRTFSAEIVTAATYVVPGTAVQISFPAGTYVLAETYEAQLQCAAMNASDLGAAMVAATSTAIGWRFAYLATTAGNGVASAHATLLAALQSELNTLAGVSKYRRGIIAADQDSDAAACVTAYTGVVAARCLVAFGDVRRVASVKLDGYAVPLANAAEVFAMRATKALFSTDLKRFNDGPLDNEGIVELIDDENITATGLDDLKVSTLRTYQNAAGKFITQAFLKSASGSDFDIWPKGIVMDVACEHVHARQLELIGRGIRVNTNTGLPAGEAGANGTIDERDAIRIEESIAATLANLIKTPQNAEGTEGHVSDFRYALSRTNNIQSTKTVISTVSLAPLAYVDAVQATLGYTLAFTLGG